MYTLGHISPQVPDAGGYEVLLSDSKEILLRNPINNQVIPLSKEQALKMIQVKIVIWQQPDMGKQLELMILTQIENHKKALLQKEKELQEKEKINLLQEESVLTNIIKGQKILSILLVVVIILTLSLGVWGVIATADPPKRAEELDMTGRMWVRSEKLETANYVSGIEIMPQTTGFLSNTNILYLGEAQKIQENIMYNPLTSNIPVMLRPLSYHANGFRQEKMVSDESVGSFAIYADNPLGRDPSLFTLNYIEFPSMISNPVFPIETVDEARQDALRRTAEGEELINQLWWDKLGSYDVDSRQIVFQAIQHNNHPIRRNGIIIWANVTDNEISSFEVDTKNNKFKSSPVISVNSKGQGHWVAYLFHSDNSDATLDGQAKIIHAFDSNVAQSPSNANSFTINELLGREPDDYLYQSNLSLVDDYLMYIEKNRIFVLDLGSIVFTRVDGTNTGNGPAYTITSSRPIDMGPVDTVPPKLLVDYKNAVYVITINKDNQIIAKPINNEDSIIVSSSKNPKTAFGVFRSRVIWIEQSPLGFELRENAVYISENNILRK